MSAISVGTQVRWESQAQGHTTTKKGRVVYNRDRAINDFGVSRKADHPIVLARELFPNHRFMFDGHSWPNGDGVLVEVRDGKTSRAKPKLYMPHPGKLKVVT